MVKESAFYKDKAYMEVLVKLRTLIAAEFREGGRLPSSREMSRRFNVSLPTYGKAIAKLLVDGTVYKDRNFGVYVYPRKQRIQKIGIVLENGKESPFLPISGLLCRLIESFRRQGFDVQLIQSGNMEHLVDKAVFYGVSSLLWYLPTPQAAPVIRDIVKKNRMPFLAVDIVDPKSDADIAAYDCQNIHFDMRYAGTACAKIFLQHGFRSIIYIGTGWYAENSGFAPTLRSNGARFYDGIPLYSVSAIRKHLARVIREHGVTAVYSEGWVEILENTARVISEMPAKEQPFLMARSFSMVPHVRRKYPELKWLGTFGMDLDPLVDRTVSIMTEHLRNGTPLHSEAVQSGVFYPA